MFKVIAPMVIVRSEGDVVYRSEGQMVDGLTSEDAERLVRRGMIVPVDGPAPTPAEPEAEPVETPAAPAVVSGGIEKPKKTHSLAMWQAYALTQGLSAEDVGDATKADLIELVG
ncbi:hypothetical protein [Gordonia sp. (in: high G+C Gram-positive bacteria)]|uniref:hypothetical protein n=1 Tax=Gordonia sp. (in: high G+C Gram-positive bacteria) TaxID=84139 RepID=UPI003C7885FE